MKLSLIHCTRAGSDPISPRQARTTKRALDAYHSRIDHWSGENELEYIFVVDNDDPISIEMANSIGGVRVVVCSKDTKWGPRLCHCNALNQGAAAATGDVIVQGDDDVTAPDRWDRVINERLGEHVGGDWLKPAILGVGDPHFGGGEYSGDGMLGTFIITRGVYNLQGYFVYPEFDGMQGDLDFTAKAALEGWLVDAYDQVYFRHFWHGGMDDEQRDAIHDRHMSKECHEIGYSVLGARMTAGFPNIEFGENLADRDLAENRFGPTSTDYQKSVSERHHAERCSRGFRCIGNKEHREGSPQWHYLKGNWKETQEAIDPLIHRYHFKICGGRFRFTYGFWLWNQCARALGMPDREDEHDRSKMKWL